MAADPALAFLAELVEAEGGAAEDRGDSVVLLVADGLRDRLRLPEELVATSDPEVAAEEGALLVAPGQPVVDEAADLVISRGDAGWRHLAWPALPPPARARLEEAARSEVVVEHGRLDLEGQPSSCYLPLVHVAALVEHRVSVEERYEEAVEVFVDGRTGAFLPDRLAEQLASLASAPGRGAGHAHADADLPRALGACRERLEARGAERQAALQREARSSLERERARVDAYYEAALSSIAARRAAAAPERARLLGAQEEATRAEWARRALEAEEKYAGSVEVRPFLLHVLEVPGLAVPLTVRRGPRRYELRLDWLLPFACYLPPACPGCGEMALLIAGRDRLGCRHCIPRVADGTDPRPAGPGPAPGAGGAVPRRGLDGGAVAVPGPSAPADRGPEATLRRLPETEAAAPEAQPAPSALHARLVEKHWRNVASDLFRAVAVGERCRSVAPRSPLDALYRCFGPSGPLVALGLPPDAWPRSLHSSPPEGEATGVLVTTGLLRTSEGVAQFSLRWRLAGKVPSLVELLPGRAPAGPGLPPRRQLAGPSADPPTPPGLRPVEARLWREEAGEEGLAFAVRCLALYWRIQGNRRLGPLGEGPLCAAVALAARRHSARRPGLEALARRYRAPAAEVREALAVLDQVLGGAAAKLW